MEIFLKYQQVILRAGGAFMLLVGFVIHFWIVPQEGFSKNDLAAANLARMEASLSGGSATSSTKGKPDASSYVKALKDTQKKQMQYLTIIAMILGVGSLGYSFKPKKEEEEQNS